MTEVTALVTQINESLSGLKRGSVVFGDIFGGRIDNIHHVVGADEMGSPSALVVYFNEGESLEVSEPDDTEFSSTTFRIGSAARVRWEWFYYGRPKVPENRLFIEHVVAGDRVSVTTDASWSGAHFAPSVERNAVELLNGWQDQAL